MGEFNKKLPLVYSCSGCSSVAQMANHIAVQMDRRGLAEMSCIAGVGGNVPALVNRALSGRKIIAIDGCPLACVAHCLSKHNITADEYICLNSLGVRKKMHMDFDKEEAENILSDLISRPY